MSDQQNPPPAFTCPGSANMLRHQIPGASIEALHRRPLHLETKSLNLRGNNIFHRDHTGKIHRPAVDIHQLLQQTNRCRRLPIDRLHHRTLNRRRWILRHPHRTHCRHNQHARKPCLVHMRGEYHTDN